MSSYWKIRRNASKFYKRLKPLKCPVFKEKVNFPSRGFRHLIFKGRKTRPKKEQISKLKYLKEAYEILKKTTTIQEYDIKKAKYTIRQKGIKKEIVTKIEYWGIVAIYEKKRIKVILRKVGKGKLHFWSVIPNWRVIKTRKGRFKRKLYKGSLKED